MPSTDPSLDIKVGGRWLREFGAWGSLNYSFAWPGGCKEASWQMTANYGARLPVLVNSAEVEISLGGMTVWSGFLTEPEWSGDEVSLTALGWFRKGEDFQAVDGSYSPTFTPSTAIAAAQPTLPWRLGDFIPTAPLPTATTEAFTVSSLLDAYTAYQGSRWYVDTYKRVSFANDPTMPAYVVAPGRADLGIADDNYASHVILRYRDSADGTVKSVGHPSPVRGGTPNAFEVRYGHKEVVEDATGSGSMSAATAAQLAQSIYAQSRQRPGWTNALTLDHGDLLTPGGRPIHPATVNAFGKLVRVHGVADEVSLTPYTDFVIAETSYADGEASVNVSPIGLASRTFEDVLSDALAQATASGLIAAA